MQYASFHVGEGLYGIPVLVVEEFFRPIEVTPVPLTDKRIEGLIHLRGKTAVVVNLGACLDQEQATLATNSKMILLETNNELTEEATEFGLRTHDEPVVLRVNRTHRIFYVEEERVQPPPAHIKHPFVCGVIREDEGYLMILSIHQLINEILPPEGVEHHVRH